MPRCYSQHIYKTVLTIRVITMSGQAVHRATITSVSLSDPCVITTSAAHGFSTGNFVRFTDLNGVMPIPRGVDPLNDRRYRIVVTGTSTFSLQDPLTFDDVDSTNYTPYTSGGTVTLIQQDFSYEGAS